MGTSVSAGVILQQLDEEHVPATPYSPLAKETESKE
jgi:hypothetical protein